MDAVVQLWNTLSKAQDAYKGKDLSDWMRDHTEIPVIFVTLYLGMVFYGQDYMKDKSPLKLKGIFTLWNFFLAVFSILGCIHTLPLLINASAENGFWYTVCERPQNWYFNGASGFWVGAFILSKIPELVDTVFLVFQKKPVIFLHWYHHTTVMLYCWIAYMQPNSVGIWFAAMNYFVHSIMYSYYFMMSLSGFTRKLVKPVGKLITALQIAQMVVGMYLVWRAHFFQRDAEGCAVSPVVNRAGMVMYTSYFVLFAKFFFDTYISGKSSKRSKIE